MEKKGFSSCLKYNEPDIDNNFNPYKDSWSYLDYLNLF